VYDEKAKASKSVLDMDITFRKRLLDQQAYSTPEFLVFEAYEGARVRLLSGREWVIASACQEGGPYDPASRNPKSKKSAGQASLPSPCGGKNDMIEPFSSSYWLS
jgi:hypothetical protein